MDQSARRDGGFAIGDYVVERQIGVGSFSTVWLACHCDDGTEVAIKEISTARLNDKLKENLKSEIVILQRITHPNIIRLHDMIEGDLTYVARTLQKCGACRILQKQCIVGESDTGAASKVKILRNIGFNSQC